MVLAGTEIDNFAYSMQSFEKINHIVLLSATS